MKKIDLAYTAGLIDGEGCIAVSRTKTSSSAKGCKRGFAYRSSISVTMTDLDILKWMQQITTVGKICRKKVNEKKHKPAWVWTVWSKEAATLANKLLPYLKIKHEQAINLIDFQSCMRYPGSKGLTDDEWNLREEYYYTSRKLNKRGVIK